MRIKSFLINTKAKFIKTICNDNKLTLLSKTEITVFLAVLTVFAVCVLLPPVHSVADQGDFERVLRQCGLYFPPDYSFFDYAQRYFEFSPTLFDGLLYPARLLFLFPSTPFIFPCTVASGVCMIFGKFDMRIMACVSAVWYAIVCAKLVGRMRFSCTASAAVFTAVFVFIFCGGVYMTFFNSFYGQSMMLITLAQLCLAYSVLFDDLARADTKKLIFFALSSCMFISSKLQCIVFAVPLVCMTVYAAAKSRKIRTGAVCAVLIVYHAVCGALVSGGALTSDTSYNSVFTGILTVCPDRERALDELDIDTRAATDAGKNAYLPRTEYTCPPETLDISNVKIVSYYLRHPSVLIHAMEKTSKSAFMSSTGMGTFEEKYGFAPKTEHFRFDWWERIRSRLPHTLVFVCGAQLLFCAVAVYGLCTRQRCFGALLLLYIMGAVQFAMPYVGNGTADVSKQLFMYNVIFDVGVCMCAYVIIEKTARLVIRLLRLLKK